jgi:hypothetical protein
MSGDKPKKGDKFKKMKQKKAKHAAYADAVAKSRLDAIAKKLRKGSGRPGRKAGSADGLKPFKDRDSGYRPENPQNRTPIAGGAKKLGDAGKAARPGASDKIKHGKEEKPEWLTPISERYKDRPPNERRFFQFLDRVAAYNRLVSRKYGTEHGSKATQLHEKSEGLDGLPSQTRMDLESGNHPQKVAFPVGNRIYLNHPATGDVKWIELRNIPHGVSHVANGRLDRLVKKGASGEADFFVHRTRGSVDVMAAYPEDKETISKLILRAKRKGLIDSMGKAQRADPDQVRSLQKANVKLNGYIREALSQGKTIKEARKFAWENAMADLRLASNKILTTVLSISTGGIRVPFGVGIGMGMMGGAGCRYRFGRLKTPTRRAPQAVESASVREGAGPGRTAASQRSASGSGAGGGRGSPSPSGRARTVYAEGRLGEIRGEAQVSYGKRGGLGKPEASASPSGRARTVYAEGRLGEIHGEAQVSYGKRGGLGKPEASASPVKLRRPIQRAQPVDRDAVRRAGAEGDLADVQEKLMPRGERTKQGTFRSADTQRTRNQQETPTVKDYQKAQVNDSYNIGLEGAKTATRDGVRIRQWEPATKFQGEYGKNIDDVGVWRNNEVLLEWKGQGSKLGPDQMSSKWAGRKIAQLEVLNEPMAGTLLQAARNGKLKGMVYRTKTDASGNLVSGRLSRADLKGSDGAKMPGESISDDGVISYSPRRVQRAYRAELKRLRDAIRDNDKEALEVLLW